jgi:hypothetical protein
MLFNNMDEWIVALIISYSIIVIESHFNLDERRDETLPVTHFLRDISNKHGHRSTHRLMFVKETYDSFTYRVATLLFSLHIHDGTAAAGCCPHHSHSTHK